MRVLTLDVDSHAAALLAAVALVQKAEDSYTFELKNPYGFDTYTYEVPKSLKIHFSYTPLKKRGKGKVKRW